MHAFAWHGSVGVWSGVMYMPCHVCNCVWEYACNCVCEGAWEGVSMHAHLTCVFVKLVE